MAIPRAVHAPHGWWPILGLLLVGVLVAASGAWFVFEWHSQNRALPGIERVQYDAAWGFAFAGLALVLNVAGLARLGRWAAAVPILLGAFRLAAVVFPGVYGIRPMVANPWLPFGDGNYNEMGVFSAALFVVLGCALMWVRPPRYQPWRSVAVALLAAVAIAVAMLLLFGAWTGGSIAARWLQLAGGERSAALLFLLLAAGILAHELLGSEQEQRAVGKWTPAIVGFSGLICTLVLWNALAEQDTRYIQNATQLVAASAKLRVEVAFEQRVRTLERLAARAGIYAFTESQFRQDAGGLLDSVAASPNLTAIAWTDPDQNVRWLIRRGRSPDPGEINFDRARLPAGDAAGTRLATIIHYVDSATGDVGVAIAAPAYDSGTLRGMVIGALAPNWLQDILRDRFADFEIRLLEGGAAISRSAADAAPAGKTWTQEQTVGAADVRWSLLVTPTMEYVRQNSSALPSAALALGIVLSVLLALCTLLFQTAYRRARALANTNARLLDDIQARRQAEQALQESERRTSLIVNAIKDCAIYMLDAQGTILTWNPGAEELTGYRREEIIGRPFFILYPAEGKPGEALATAASNGSVEAECWHLRKDGARFLGDDVVSGMRDERGELQGYSVITRDATHRVELRQQTESSRDFYMSLFSGFPNLVWRSDASGGCDYLNQAWLDFTGRAHDDQLGHGWLSAMHPEDQPLWNDAFKRAFPGQQPFEMEFRLRRAKGEYGWIICNGRPYHDQSGRFAGYLFSCYDNTARRAVEDALKESEERVERITSNIPGMVFKLQQDKDGGLAFLYVSSGCEAVTGLPVAALVANATAFFDLVPAADRTHLLATLEASSAELGNWNWSGRLRPSHEIGEKWVTLRAKPRRAGEGLTVWDGVVVDDTQVRLAQLELERSREDLRALSRHIQSVREEEKARIAREVHDELGSTLTALKMDLAWLSSKLERTETGEIKQKRAAMAKLVDAAVASTRKVVTDLRPSVLDDLGLAAALRWQATEFGRHAGASVRVDAPDADIAMSRDISLTLFRIFQETLTNISRHAKASEVDVKLTTNDGAFVLQIRDNGIGFDEKNLAKPTSHGIRGMRERAREFGGDISVSSKPGGGTTLVITVPRDSA